MESVPTMHQKVRRAGIKIKINGFLASTLSALAGAIPGSVVYRGLSARVTPPYSLPSFHQGHTYSYFLPTFFFTENIKATGQELPQLPPSRASTSLPPSGLLKR